MERETLGVTSPGVPREGLQLLLNSSYKELVCESLLPHISEDCCVGHSEEVGLTHDAHELVLRDLTITVAISLLDHLLALIVSHVLA